jgi:hypothetical protein
VNCGDVQVERGAVLAGGIFSVYSAAAEVRPMNDNQPASPPKADVSKQRHKHILKRFDWECDPPAQERGYGLARRRRDFSTVRLKRS